MDYVKISEEEDEEPVELPTEEDGTLLLSTLQAQFPGACGLKFRNEETKTARGVRLNEGRFYPQPGKNGWGTQNYYCVFPKENKRKSDDNLENSTAKTKRVDQRLRCTDLIVLGLSFKTTEESLREHFEKFGEVLMAQVKKDFKTGQSKGFGFVRFSSYESQIRVLAVRHFIDERWCEVKIPNSKEGIIQQLPSKIFVGRLTEDISADDLREYFSKFGEVTDVFIPRPFRAFSFITFLDPETAQSLCGEDHIIKGVSVYVSNAAPKTERNRNNGGGGGSGSGGSGGNYNNYNNPNNGFGTMMNRGNNYYRSAGGGGYGYSGNMSGYSNGGNYGGMNNGMMPNSYNGGYNYNSSNVSGGHGNMGFGNGGGNSSWNKNSYRSNMDMPNLQSLGINSQGQNVNSNSGASGGGGGGGGQGPNNPLNLGLNLGSMPMNPAIVAAALNNWGLLSGNFPNQSQQDQGGGNGGSGGGNSNSNQSWSRKSNVSSSQNSDQQSANNFLPLKEVFKTENL